MVKWLKNMLHVKPSVAILGSMWSRQEWMNDDNTIDFPHVADWVDYFVKYVKTYRDEGVRMIMMMMMYILLSRSLKGETPESAVVKPTKREPASRNYTQCRQLLHNRPC